MDDSTIDADAVLGDVLTLTESLNVNDAVEGTLGDLSTRLDTIKRTVAALKVLTEGIEQTLIDDMEADEMAFDHFVVQRQPTVRATWKPGGAQDMRRDMKQAAIARVCTDVATGEIDPMKRNVAAAAIDELMTGVPAFTSIIKASRERWGLRVGDYREFTDGQTIKLIPREQS